MQASQKIIEFLKEKEGFSAAPYLDPVGVPTIGYGTTMYEDGRKVSMSDDPISKERGEELLRFHLKERAERPLNNLKLNLEQHEFDALVSFIYNLGIGNFLGSTLLKKIKGGNNKEEVRKQFLRWNKAKGKTLPGLTKRREIESRIYTSGIYV